MDKQNKEGLVLYTMKEQDYPKEFLNSLSSGGPREGGPRGGEVWRLHHGVVNGIGYISDVLGGRRVTISWNVEDSVFADIRGNFSDQLWEIFKLAYESKNGKIELASPLGGFDWCRDFRFLRAYEHI